MSTEHPTHLRIVIDPSPREPIGEGQPCRALYVAVGDQVFRLAAQRGTLEIMTTGGEALSVDPMAANCIHVHTRT